MADAAKKSMGRRIHDSLCLGTSAHVGFIAKICPWCKSPA